MTTNTSEALANIGGVNIDLSEIMSALGGGATAVMVIGMGYALWLLWRRYVFVQDARIEDQKMHTAQLIESMRTLDKAMDFLEGRRG